MRLLLLLALGCWPSGPETDPAQCPPNDPGYPGSWEFRGDIPTAVDQAKMHPAERALGAIGFSLDRAWQHTTGRDDVVIAVLDSGIRWREVELRRKLFLNRGELPTPAGHTEHDADGNGRFDVDDYAGDPRVPDANGNGHLDAGDLIAAFSDCVDDDGNGYPDDISGYDFFQGEHCGFAAGGNDPTDRTDFGHGTGIAETAAGETDNGIGDAGVCPRCRILPVRVGDSFVVDANRFARGLTFAVRSGVDVVASALGSYNNTPAARAAVDLAWEEGVPLIASAADEYAYHHNYPSVYNHALYVNSIRTNHRRDWRRASTFWGVNPCTNYGARVWLSVPATSCSSGATSRLAGAVGLMQSMARETHGARLHAEEVYQVLRATADDLDNREPDWGALRWPALPGFDQYYGYGRLNAERAVLAVRAGGIPPIADLHGPRWFEIVSPRLTPTLPVEGSIALPRATAASWSLAYALGVEPRESDYVAVGGGRVRGAYRGRLGTLDFRDLPLPEGPRPRGREDRDRYSVTLRLRVRDDAGRLAEARRSFFVFHDPTWKRHFPYDLNASGEAGPLLHDLDGDGRDEIVLPAADGYLRILSWSARGVSVVKAPYDALPPIDPRGRVPTVREGALRGAVLARISKTRTAIVSATREGKVYLHDARGERLPGFPVATAAVVASSREAVVEAGILSKPVAADLDGDGRDEIVVSALDGKVYVWRADGTPAPGFPVTLVGAKIVSSPAVADLDGDGSPELVVGTNGLDGGFAAAYAVRARGNLDPGGAIVPGWPVEVPGLRPDLLPTLASGIRMTPLAVDLDADGDAEIGLFAVTGTNIVWFDTAGGKARAVAEASFSPGPGGGFEGMTFLGGTGSALVVDADRDGRSELYAPALPMRMLTLRTKPGVPLDVPLVLGAWDPGSGPMRAGWPVRMEDLMVFAEPAAADVDGDDELEILMGSGGYLVHAFDPTGAEASSFPKFTGGWTFSAPAVGDLDGDGRPEIVSVTREGYLFAWETGSGSSSITR